MRLQRSLEFVRFYNYWFNVFFNGFKFVQIISILPKDAFDTQNGFSSNAVNFGYIVVLDV